MKKAIFSLITAGALLLAVSQFLPLYHTHVTSQAAAVGSGSVGASHVYSVLALALLAGFLGWGVWGAASRFILLLVGLLGAAALAIALGRDLHDARAHGLRLVGNHYETATNVVGFGLYVEILGALLLLFATVVGFLLVAPARNDPAAGADVAALAARRRNTRRDSTGRLPPQPAPRRPPTRPRSEN